MSRRTQRADKARRLSGMPGQRPKYGPWNDQDVSGWTICADHDYGVPPGGTCMSCRLSADMAADPEAYGLPD